MHIIKFIALCLLLIIPLATSARRGTREVCLQLTPSPRLAKFVDKLPIIPRIYLSSKYKLTLGAYKITQKLHRDLPETTLYAFGTNETTAIFPGPTLIAQKNDVTFVRWENHIRDTSHILPVDDTLDRATSEYGYVPIVVHLHGQEGYSWSDGHPEAWFTSVGEKGPKYVTQDYVYINAQRPTLLWYHDHTYGITRINVAAGLFGLYVIESPNEDPSWVPKEYFLLVIQDQQFFDDGYINYPNVGVNPAVHPQWCPDYFGDTVLVNGKVWPYVEVTPTTHRFRMLVAANARFFNFRMNHSGLSFLKIGTDGGYLRYPIRQQQLRLAPSERADVIIDFSGLFDGENVLLYNDAPAPFPQGNVTVQAVLLFKVVCKDEFKGRYSKNESKMPPILRAKDVSDINMPILKLIKLTTGLNLSYVNWAETYNRPFIHNAALDSGNNLIGLFLQDRLTFGRSVTEMVKLYTNEVWCLINNMNTAHPIHIHLLNFFFLEQQPFHQDRLNNGSCSFDHEYPDSQSCFSGEATGPDVDQLGWKDTIVVQPFHASRFFLRMRPTATSRFEVDPTTYPHFIWHCHLLEHEDNEMMRPLVFSHTEGIYTNSSFPHFFPKN